MVELFFKQFVQSKSKGHNFAWWVQLNLSPVLSSSPYTEIHNAWYKTHEVASYRGSEFFNTNNTECLVS